MANYDGHLMKDFEDAQANDEYQEPRIEKRKAARRVSCIGCGKEQRIALNALHGSKHNNCAMTNGVVGYWVEVPQEDEYLIIYPNGSSLPLPPMPDGPQAIFDDPICAMEHDYIRSFGGE